jgi:hypothetical protein
MKKISIVGLLIVLGACSTHALKCRGPLRPINKPTASASTPGPAAGSTSAPQPSPGEQRSGPADPFRTEPQP